MGLYRYSFKEFSPEMFIIAVLKKTEETNIEQNYRSALSALLREFYFILIQAFNKLLSLQGGLLARRGNPE
jgi:hypothetical protein